ncbi:MAG: class I SAM-dependent methyltransferase [Caldilineaceae bacterium]
MNFFSFKRVAEGYATHRPYYHPIIMAKIGHRLGRRDKLDQALDVGCGTGLSTVALQALAHHVVGVDSSAAMIDVAHQHDQAGLTFYCAPAEELPFAAQSFNLLTVCGAINWIDRSRFLPEAQRVLQEKGWLVIYDNFITDRMQENRAYTAWHQEQFLARYPKPPRDETPLTSAEAANYGFTFAQETYTNELAMSRAQYVEFMLTQSNVIAAVEMGEESLTAAREWMNTSLAGIIPDPAGTFLFGGYLWYLQSK